VPRTAWNTIHVDPLTLATTVEGSLPEEMRWTGPKNFIEGLSAGRKAALSIHRYLSGEDIRLNREEEGVATELVGQEAPDVGLVRGADREQLAYAAKDAAVLWPLKRILAPALTAAGLDRVADLEFKVLAPVVDMELSGVGIDHNAWKSLFEQRQALAETLKGSAAEALGVVNINSQPEVMMALKHLGIPATGTSAEALAPFSTRPEIRKFLDFKAAVTFPRQYRQARHECTGAESLQGRSNPPKSESAGSAHWSFRLRHAEPPWHTKGARCSASGDSVPRLCVCGRRLCGY